MQKVLSQFSDAIAQTVEQAGAYVIRVEGRRGIPATGIAWRVPGVIVTAHHALESDGPVTVGLPTGPTATATLIGRDPTTDLAALRLDGAQTTSPTWAEPEGLRVGHLALVLGRPGKTVRAALGIISALGDVWRTPAGGQIDRYLQTDVTMYPGFSGGPLVDSQGQVIGMATSGLLRGAAIAVPTPTVARVLDALLAHGRVRRGYLGVGAAPVRLPQTIAQQAGQETGLLLSSIEDGSPAERANLLLGDIILRIGGLTTRMPDDLIGYLAPDRIGAEVEVQLLRAGRIATVAATIGERG